MLSPLTTHSAESSNTLNAASRSPAVKASYPFFVASMFWFDM